MNEKISKKLILLFVFLLISPQIQAVDDTTSGWLGTFIKKDFGEKNFLWAETQLRHSLEKGTTNQILYRVGLIRALNEKHSIGFLYAFVQGGALKEHRLTFQHGQKYGQLGSYLLSARSRVEARFLENSDDNAMRFRYLIRAEENKDRTFSPVIWNESFINLSDDTWTGMRRYERNRLFLGFKEKVHSSQIEFGYLNQYVPRSTGDISEHTLVIYLFF